MVSSDNTITLYQHKYAYLMSFHTSLAVISYQQVCLYEPLAKSRHQCRSLPATLHFHRLLSINCGTTVVFPKPVTPSLTVIIPAFLFCIDPVIYLIFIVMLFLITSLLSFLMHSVIKSLYGHFLEFEKMQRLSKSLKSHLPSLPP